MHSPVEVGKAQELAASLQDKSEDKTELNYNYPYLLHPGDQNNSVLESRRNLWKLAISNHSSPDILEPQPPVIYIISKHTSSYKH